MGWGNVIAGVGTAIGALKGGGGGGGGGTTEVDPNLVSIKSANQMGTSTGVEKVGTRSASKGRVTGTSTQKTQDRVRSSEDSVSRTQQTNVGQSTATQNTTNVGQSLGFEAGIMDQLNSLLGGAIGDSGLSEGQQAINTRLQQLAAEGAGAGFDPNAYADRVTAAAATRAQGDLESRINSMQSQVGGTETGNTMAALLGQRLRTDAATELAGVRASAEAQGQQIRQQQQGSITDQMLGLQGAGSDTLQGLITALRGAQGTETQVGTSTGTETSRDTTTGTNRTNVDSNSTSTGTSTGRTSQNSNESVIGSTTSQSAATNDVFSDEAAIQTDNNDGSSGLFDRIEELFNSAREGDRVAKIASGKPKPKPKKKPATKK